MGKIYEELDERLCQFIVAQKMFFVGSAPRDDEGLINISPKGMESLRVLDPKTVAYLDLTGSGIESVAHIKENGRFVIMFCSFDQSPKILRLHGKASVVEPHDPEWQELRSHFPQTRMARAIIRLAVTRIADSCGWGVPIYSFVAERDQYGKYAAQIADAELRQSQLKSNMMSIDGLPGLKKPAI